MKERSVLTFDRIPAVFPEQRCHGASRHASVGDLLRDGEVGWWGGPPIVNIVRDARC